MLSAQMRSAIVQSDWFETSWAPWVLLDTDLVIRAVNGAFEREFGMTREEVDGRALFEVFPENPSATVGTHERLAATLEQVIRTGRPHWRGVQRYDVVEPGTGGEFRYRVWIPFHLPVIEDGHVVGILVSSQDVTVPLAAADRDALAALHPGELESAAELLLRQFPGAEPSLVLSTLAHSHRRVLEATGNADPRSASDLARLRLEARTGRPAVDPQGVA